MILQFGTGNFLRAFVELFVEQVDSDIGPVIAVQSTGRERADAINQADGKYHIAIQGFQNGVVVDEICEVHSLGEALHAGTQWDRVVDTARDPDLIAIVSNTTEAGLALDDRDCERTPPTEAPHSFPAKLLAALAVRFEAGQPAPWVVPCELVDANGDHLRGLVCEQAKIWNIDHTVIDWIENQCRWVNTLVDRIVPGTPKSHPLLATDPLLISCEPFALWAVETERDDFPFAAHPAVITAPDISAYTLRKVRILNGAHTALVCRAVDSNVSTVRECVEHPEIGPWLGTLLFDEIVPALEGRCDDPAQFARDTLDRFRNPFLDHQLSAIALHHESKVAVRLQPTAEEFLTRFGRPAPLLSELTNPG
jgi:tagaturonate reductase